MDGDGGWGRKGNGKQYREEMQFRNLLSGIYIIPAGGLNGHLFGDDGGVGKTLIVRTGFKRWSSLNLNFVLEFLRQMEIYWLIWRLSDQLILANVTRGVLCNRYCVVHRKYKNRSGAEEGK